MAELFCKDWEVHVNGVEKALHLRCGDIEDRAMLLLDQVQCAEEVIRYLRDRIVRLEDAARQKPKKAKRAAIHITVAFSR
jgi:hypothetical protein